MCDISLWFKLKVYLELMAYQASLAYLEKRVIPDRKETLECQSQV